MNDILIQVVEGRKDSGKKQTGEYLAETIMSPDLQIDNIETSGEFSLWVRSEIPAL